VFFVVDTAERPDGQAGRTRRHDERDDTTTTRIQEGFVAVNVVVVVTFRFRSKLRRTAGALAQAVVKAVGASCPTQMNSWVGGSR
jgi:hypothetical protein